MANFSQAQTLNDLLLMLKGPFKSGMELLEKDWQDLDAALKKFGVTLEDLEPELEEMTRKIGKFEGAESLNELIQLLKGPFKSGMELTEQELRDLDAAMAKFGVTWLELEPALAEMTTHHKTAREQLATFGSALAGIIPAVARPFQMLTGVISQAAASVAPFVQALAPGAMMMFSQAMRNLQATIGTALLPIVQHLAGFLQQLSGILLPLMQALAPIISNLMRTLSALVLPIIQGFATLLQPLLPLLEFLSGIVRVVAEALQALSTIGRAFLQTLLEAYGAAFGMDLKKGLEGFKDVIHAVVRGLVQVVAMLAKLVGADAFLGHLVDNLHDLANPRVGATAAPQGSSMQGFEQIAQQMAVAAFGAFGGGGADKSEKDFLKELADTVKKIRSEQRDIERIIVDALTKWWKGLTDEGRRLLGPVRDLAATPVGGGLLGGVSAFFGG
jgi:hypothetical protein